MKAVKFFIVVLLAFSVLSCVKSSDDGFGGEKEITIQIKLSSVSSRAETGQVPTGYVSSIKTAYLYVVNRNGIIIAGETFSQNEIEAGSKIILTTDDAAEILIIANYPSTFNPAAASITSKPVLERTVFALSDLVPDPIEGDPEAADQNKHGVKYAMLYNSATAAETNRVDSEGRPVWEGTVALAPVVTRFEIGGVSGTAPLSLDTEESGIVSFTLAGIYMNNVYPGLTLANGVTASETKLSGEITLPQTSTWYGDVFDGIYTAEREYKTANGNAWAFHLAPVNNGTADVPSLVLHLTDVVFDVEDEELPSAVDNLYVVVKSYVDRDGAPYTRFRRGYVYRIGSLVFNRSHIYNTSDPEGITFSAVVTPLPWVPTYFIDVEY